MRGFSAFPTGIQGLQAVAAESDHVFPRHFHEEFGIGLVRSGGQISASGRGQVEAGPGDVITVNPGEVHDGLPVGDEGRRWTMFYLSPDCMAEIASGFTDRGIASLEFHMPVLGDRRVACRFAALWETFAEPVDALSNLARDEALLALLADVLGSKAETARVSGNAAIARARAVIDDDPTASPTLASLAAEAGLSRFQTLRAFAKATGLTPHAYLVQKRLHLARRLMTSGLGLAAIAADCGFADQSHMTRAFRRHYGLTPAAFRAVPAGCNPVQDPGG